MRKKKKGEDADDLTGWERGREGGREGGRGGEGEIRYFRRPAIKLYLSLLSPLLPLRSLSLYFPLPFVFPFVAADGPGAAEGEEEEEVEEEEEEEDEDFSSFFSRFILIPLQTPVPWNSLVAPAAYKTPSNADFMDQ
jgi:hypothetical protein